MPDPKWLSDRVVLAAAMREVADSIEEAPDSRAASEALIRIFTSAVSMTTPALLPAWRQILSSMGYNP